MVVVYMIEMVDEWWLRREGFCWVFFIIFFWILWWIFCEIGFWICCVVVIVFLMIFIGGIDMYCKDYVVICCGNILINWWYLIRIDWYYWYDIGFFEWIFWSVLFGERELIFCGYVVRVMWLENYCISFYFDESEN